MLKKLINEQNRIYGCISKNRQAIKYHICPCHNISFVSFILVLPLTDKRFFFCSSVGLLSPDLFPEKNLIVCNRKIGMRFHWSCFRTIVEIWCVHIGHSNMLKG